MMNTGIPGKPPRKVQHRDYNANNAMIKDTQERTTQQSDTEHYNRNSPKVNKPQLFNNKFVRTDET